MGEKIRWLRPTGQLALVSPTCGTKPPYYKAGEIPKGDIGIPILTWTLKYIYIYIYNYYKLCIRIQIPSPYERGFSPSPCYDVQRRIESQLGGNAA